MEDESNQNGGFRFTVHLLPPDEPILEGLSVEDLPRRLINVPGE